MRDLPNIVITGTPGTGKTSHAQSLVEHVTSMKHFSINQLARERRCICGRDEERDSDIVDESKLVNSIENDLEKGGLVIDWHVSDVFPESLIDLVVVLRSDTEVLYDRLKSRSYSQAKIEENIDAEVMQVILQEALEAYGSQTVVELNSNTIEDLESNVDRLIQWQSNWLKNSS